MSLKRILLKENDRVSTKTISNDILFDHDTHEYFVRWASHIEADLDRNWSSWNFGGDGFEGTREQLEREIKISKKYKRPFYISGFEIWDDDLDKIKFLEDWNVHSLNIQDYVIGELYENYWVLVDIVNGRGALGLAGHAIPENIESLTEAVEWVKNNPKADGTGEGDWFDAADAEVIYSNNKEGEFGFHIIKVG